MRQLRFSVLRSVGTEACLSACRGVSSTAKSGVGRLCCRKIIFVTTLSNARECASGPEATYGIPTISRMLGTWVYRACPWIP